MTTVNFHHNLQVGAPVLTGQAGSLISVLDATLVTGWGLQTATGNVSGGIATLTTPNTHAFDLYQIALVSGASNALLNGRHRVIARTSNTISFAAPGVPDGVAGGSISVRVAPAGWDKVFSGTNKAVYRSSDPTGTRMFLRVDDTGGNFARVVGYESMSDVDTGEGPFPTPAQLSGGGFWLKATAIDSTARAWTVIADTRSVYLHMHTSPTAITSGISGCVWGFVDVSSYMPTDPYGSALFAAITNAVGAAGVITQSLEYCATSTAGTAHMARSYTGIGGAAAIAHTAESFLISQGVSGAGFGMATGYPNQSNNGLALTRKYVVESSNLSMRGTLPGLHMSPQNCHASFNRNDIVDGQGHLAGRKLLTVKCGSPSATISQGSVFFDITGPWA